jgi:predicted DNA-binding protein (MmcQ/YjbR family)
MFLITSPDTVPVSASFKTDEEEFEALIAKEGLKPAAYLARYKWVHIDDIDRLSRKEWEKIINSAYRLVGSKLPKSLRKKIKFEF